MHLLQLKRYSAVVVISLGIIYFWKSHKDLNVLSTYLSLRSYSHSRHRKGTPPQAHCSQWKDRIWPRTSD